MDNREEIMKEFNEMFGEKNNDSVEPYSTNLNNNMLDTNSFNNNEILQNNIVIDNNQNININDTVVTNDENFVNSINENSAPQLVDTTSYISNEQVQKKKTPKNNTTQVNPELKTAIILVIVLLGVMAIIPTLFDWLTNLKMSIFG